ncbi:hypothetical protein [Nostoc sp. CCY 9925]|uniref:hypothetical protein n=1 Tax=Nostoc sp. CCY 9925 TaxID=3103865 RepID=UPI0039C60428
MTHTIYSQQQLRSKSLAQLKRIYSEIGCTLEVQDRRRRAAWISAVVSHQAAQLQKIARSAKDEQEIAQGEFDRYIADQAQAVAPEELAIKEINPHHFEIFAGKQLIAYISYDNGEFVTQPWVVMVNGNEIFRYTTLARCQRFIYWHYKDGTLNNSQLPSRNSQLNTIPKSKDFGSLMNQSDNCVSAAGRSPLRTANCELLQVPIITEISFYDQEAFVNGELIASISFDDENHENLYWRVLVNKVEIFRDTTPARCHSYVKQQYQQGTLPVQEPFEEPCTTGNEIMSQIFNACEQHGLELLEDGIYTKDGERLGSVSCTNGNWWVIRASSGQHKRACESVDEAVQLLLVPEVASYEELLDKAFDELTADEWGLLMESEPVRELIAA